jgi:hypothetical protein
LNGAHRLRNCADVNSWDKNINITMSKIKYMLYVVCMEVGISKKSEET